MHKLTRRCAALSLLAALIALPAGCGPSGPETYEVSGEVTFDGQPVADGEIVFRAADGSAASWAGKIENGRYSLPATAGKKRVEITAFRQVKIDAPPESAEGDISGIPYIPPKYNSQSELAVEVTPEGPNEFDFPLEP